MVVDAMRFYNRNSLAGCCYEIQCAITPPKIATNSQQIWSTWRVNFSIGNIESECVLPEHTQNLLWTPTGLITCWTILRQIWRPGWIVVWYSTGYNTPVGCSYENSWGITPSWSLLWDFMKHNTPVGHRYENVWCITAPLDVVMRFDGP